ncbi:enoyl-CoA hydratase [Geodermatophilus sabuli]|uniref:enoyl-CoA hydratase-related protein n=1 Tax=Geodermatophilus sabuli TaxID=1564158 RepID=UPI00161A86DC|nr:enoyl-CoA hydratase-related protein [Geodermatophilus sabuli]MBB3082522.1 enoyl-CoA hydratase [Geodermatophilus sabuli]
MSGPDVVAGLVVAVAMTSKELLAMYERYQTMGFELSGSGVLTVTFLRADKLNAIDAEFHRELSTVFADIGMDRRVRAVVLTGAGRAFCAGGDLEWIAGETPVTRETTLFEAKKIVDDLLNVPQPVIAAVNGAAAGYGFTMALMSDFSIVAEDARLSDPHVVIGLVAGDGGAMMWPILVGMARAKRHLLTGDPVVGSVAAEWGLVTEACPAGEVLPRALALAERMAASPQVAVQGTKKALNAILHMLSSLTLDLGFQAERLSAVSEDHQRLLAEAREARARRRASAAVPQ